MVRSVGFRVAAIMLPWLLVLIGYASFAARCEDGFCPGLLLEMAVAMVVFAGVVAGVAMWALRRGVPTARAAVGAWFTAVALGAFVFALSQFNELDTGSALIGCAVAIVAEIIAWWSLRMQRFRAG